jgi:hypothetical protein
MGRLQSEEVNVMNAALANKVSYDIPEFPMG